MSELYRNKKAIQKVGAILVICFLCLGLVAGLFSVEPASAGLTYTVSKSGSAAVVSLGGSTLYSSSSHSQVFSYLFGQVSSGDIIEIQSGTYTTSGSAFTMEYLSDLTIIAANDAIFTIPNSANHNVWVINYCSDIEWEGGVINGNKAGQSTAWTTDGIIMYNTVNAHFVNVTITNCYRDGFACYNDNDQEGTTNGISESTITHCGWNGLTLDGNYSYSINNEIAYCSDVGVTTYGRSPIVSNNYIHDMNGTTNTQAHWAIGVEDNGYGQIINNIIENCAVGLSIAGEDAESQAVVGNMLARNNTISETDVGISLSGKGFNTVINNTITNWGVDWAWGIRSNANSSDIIAYNTLTSSSTDGALGYPIWLYNTTDSMIFNNTITTNLAAGVNGIFIQLTNSTLMQGNIVQAGTGINVYQSSSYYNRLNQNNLSASSTEYSNTGTETIIVGGSGASSTTYFFDDFSSGDYSGWSTTGSYNDGPWIVESPTYNGSSYAAKLKYSYDYATKNFASNYATLNVSFAIRWSANLAASETLRVFEMGATGGDPVGVSLRNNEGTMEWGMQWNTGATTVTNWTSTGSPTANNWYDVTIAFVKGESLKLYANGTELFSKTDIQSYYNANSASILIIDSATTYPDVFYGYVWAYVSSGSSLVSLPNSWLNINQHTLHGSVSPIVGRYTYSNTSSANYTLTPDTYYSGVLNIDNENVTLSSNQYSQSMTDSHISYVLFELTSSPEPTPTPTPTVTPSPSPTPILNYNITVISAYGSPTANITVAAGTDYATSVTSPYAGTTGTRYTCTGYSIDNSGAGVQYTGTSYTFTNIQANHTIYYYWQTQYYVTVSSAYGSPTGQGWYNAGASASLSVSQVVSGGTGTQYLFSGWVGSGSGSYTGSSYSTTITVNAPITETANWITQYYLTVSSLYGATSGSGWYNSGTTAYAGLDNGTQTVGAITYTFSGWSTGGSNYAQSDPITMASALTIVAYWIPGANQYIIYASAGSGGTISPEGMIAILEGGSQTFTITPDTDYEISTVQINGVNIGAVSSYTFTNVTSDQTIVASFTPISSAAETQTVDFYMRSDTYTTVGVSGYGLDIDYTNDYIDITLATSSTTVMYGFRVYVVTSASYSVELTSGVPEGQILLSENFTGQISSSWNCPTTTTILGYQALKVVVYTSTDNATSWTAQATYITPVLMTKELVASTWTFALNVNITQTTGTVCTYSFGDTNYRSTVTGVVMAKPLDSDLSGWRLSRNDYIGFWIGTYMDKIGLAAYVLIMLIPTAVLYFRYGHAGVIVFFFTIFGGSGGLAWILIPAWAAAPLSAILILAFSFVTWRVIK